LKGAFNGEDSMHKLSKRKKEAKKEKTYSLWITETVTHREHLQQQ
jgi:hypothetical protein